MESLNIFCGPDPYTLLLHLVSAREEWQPEKSFGADKRLIRLMFTFEIPDDANQIPERSKSY